MSCSGAAAGYRDPVKVVIINTQYVETDAMSFKSVVQRLTGKDSKIEIDPSSNSNSFIHKDQQRHHRQQKTRFHQSSAASVNPEMSRGLSFKDLDKLLKELPPLDEFLSAML
ncbi:hypothetical protein ACH5RR_028272 [Cinchona calisaya]|uniref:VQ domain-containing protein n=1 Tax=Cinchona calisaya TaxID=153742 RepID=A0ABD2YQH7_9GENT